MHVEHAGLPSSGKHSLCYLFVVAASPLKVRKETDDGEVSLSRTRSRCYPWRLAVITYQLSAAAKRIMDVDEAIVNKSQITPQQGDKHWNAPMGVRGG
jgi:hypothetical protein